MDGTDVDDWGFVDVVDGTDVDDWGFVDVVDGTDVDDSLFVDVDGVGSVVILDDSMSVVRGRFWVVSGNPLLAFSIDWASSNVIKSAPSIPGGVIG